MRRVRRVMATAVGGTILATAGTVALTPQIAFAGGPCGSAVIARSTGTYAWGTLLTQGPMCGRNQAGIWRHSGGLHHYTGPIGPTSSVTASNGTNAGNDWRWGYQGQPLSAWHGCPINYQCDSTGEKIPI